MLLRMTFLKAYMEIHFQIFSSHCEQPFLRSMSDSFIFSAFFMGLS